MEPGFREPQSLREAHRRDELKYLVPGDSEKEGENLRKIHASYAKMMLVKSDRT